MKKIIGFDNIPLALRSMLNFISFKIRLSNNTEKHLVIYHWNSNFRYRSFHLVLQRTQTKHVSYCTRVLIYCVAFSRIKRPIYSSFLPRKCWNFLCVKKLTVLSSNVSYCTVWKGKIAIRPKKYAHERC